MPQIQFLSALCTILRARQRKLAAQDRPSDAGDIVQYVVITAALAMAAVVIVAIIVTKITNKASSLQTE
ncbi:hypothetical protein [Sporichthya polymorpha]|uniref:hypothetical protein n=1 Tax=Sporichthya polymorpha TaxID=35751 RepID=UPI000377E916|nr:hypothetical protein [Sporichthya polymorpha]